MTKPLFAAEKAAGQPVAEAGRKRPGTPHLPQLQNHQGLQQRRQLCACHRPQSGAGVSPCVAAAECAPRPARRKRVAPCIARQRMNAFAVLAVGSMPIRFRFLLRLSGICMP